MNLKEFLLLASQDEQKTLVEHIGSTPGYLTRIAYNKFCSPKLAVKIESGTAKLAKRNDRLERVDMSSYIRESKKWQYKVFQEKIGTAA